MQDPVAVRNFLALKKKSYDIKFDLENTDYEAIEKIGSGAYGVVCSAVHKKTKEKFAIKKIPNIFEQITIAKRTYREIKILKHFKHDNIISIYEILGPTETSSPMNDIYIVLDLMESDLHRIIHSHQELTEEHLKYFLFQLLRGLKYIHSANVLHRDLKPSNLLVNENCELKIGDFGMARGVSTQPDSYNYSMTSYVATRWYRAPELLMLRQSYTGAVDMWSVGCIFAEMLTRKQLFPGHDYIHQLKLIFGALGRPSDNFLSLAPQGIVKDFLRGVGPKTAVPMETLFPKASRKARDLLCRMLTVDAAERITVTSALSHPFLSKYHDPDDEPICIPVFDFEFEKQELNAEQLRGAIVREIKDYCKASVPLLTFDLHPVVSPDSQMAAPAGTMPLAVGGGSLPVRDTQGSGGFICGKTSSMSECERGERPTHLAVEATRVITDVEMLSGKLLELNMQDEGSRPGATCGRGAELRVCGDTPDLRDVVMLSAKARTESGEGKVGPVDTKALIKAALLNAEQRRQQHESGKSFESGRPVTAMQRQREREEKRRRKMEKAKEKRKQKKEKDKKAALVLTDEDRSLLERWQSMQTRDQPPQTLDTAVTGGFTQSRDTAVTGGFTQSLDTAVTRGFTQSRDTAVTGGFTQSRDMAVTGGFTQSRDTAVTGGFTQSRDTAVTGGFTQSRDTAVTGGFTQSRDTAVTGVFTQTDTSKPDPAPTHTVTDTSLLTRDSYHTASDQLHQHLVNMALGLDTLHHDEAVIPSHTDHKSRVTPQVVDAPIDQTRVSEAVIPVTGHNHLPTYHEAVQAKLCGHIKTATLTDHTSDSNNPHFLSLAPGVFTHTLPPGGSVPPGCDKGPSRVEFAAPDIKPVDELPTLACTPKGTGSGYGVGLDLDGLLHDAVAEQKDREREGLDSAPLSASLIADWLEVSGNMNIHDIEAALQQELEITSPILTHISP